MLDDNTLLEERKAKMEAGEDAILENNLVRLKAVADRTGIDIHDVILYQTLDAISTALFTLDLT